ncbi:uncharacterized protein LOC128557035 [Mercenaria mercenaria]|uniref:uncharacterized protein LOC128557035 n=1 Tax=Mercenaria mercenaria TaxID=6596 RepID=UPI00234F4E1C|nr:uncharacterized protein LOC128557035 [Mercenaria mercenaria]XP_053399475.1 uncharacterized protein LOC128557035 [Mercenaria mercenaria]XP_053399476.1 uncharacterized protein LOC128557035 [Mercenaria mercenaria]
MYKIWKFSIHVYGLLILQLCDGCEGIKISDFQDFCGDTIYNGAGELRFDAQNLPSHLFKCSVTIQPKSDVLTETTRVLFYFTKFDLAGTCEDLSVTVLDGSLFDRTYVGGLPIYICGHNTSLEESDQIFTTKSDQFTVIINKNDFVRYSTGNFSIKFIAFHTGDCESISVANCSNGRCVASEYFCSDDINACGEHQIQCDYIKAIAELFEAIVDIIKKYSWIVPVLIGLCVLKCICKRNRRSISDLKSSTCSGLRKLFSNCRELIFHRDTGRRPSNSSDNSNFVQLQPVQRTVSVHRARENVREALVEASDVFNAGQSSNQSEVNSLNENNHNTNSYADHTWSSDTEHRTYEPTAPPPSYDEAVAPSYEEVIRNQHKYKTTL